MAQRSSALRMHQPNQAVGLTEAQEGLWYAQRLDPSNPIFNTAHCTWLRGPIRLPQLQQAIQRSLDEADALSLCFIDDAEYGPRQYLEATHAPKLEVVDLRHHVDAQATALSAMQADQQQAIDPTAQPLARHLLFYIAEDCVAWYQRVHHLAADGYAMSLLEQQALQYYEASGHAEASAPAPLRSVTDVIAEDQSYRQGERRLKDQQYWHETLAGLDSVLSLSTQTALSAHRFLRAEAPICEATQRLLNAAQTHFEVSWPDLLTLFTAAYIQRHLNQNQVVVGVPYMGRLGHCSARSVATVMNVAPLVLTINQRQPMAEFLHAGAQQLTRTRRHGRYRSEQLRRELGYLGGLRRLHGPLVNILPFDRDASIAELHVQQQILCAGPVEDLNFNFRAGATGSGLRLEIEANPKLYTAADLTTHLARFTEFLAQALQAPRLSTVPTLTPHELDWVHAQNHTHHPIPNQTLSELVQAQCQQHAEAIALEFEGHALSFAQFDQQIQQYAQHLANLGVQRGDIVAVMAERSLELLVVLHAIIRAGAAYLPLDPTQPSERLSRILLAATPRILVQAHASELVMSEDTQVITLASLAAPVAIQRPIQPPKPVDPAYVLYTSGSTGEPKGVVVGHTAIVNRLLWMKTHYQLSSQQRFLQKTPYTFDVSLWELFLPMLCGASLTIAAPELHKDPYALATLIRQQRIDVVHFVPSMLGAFLNEPLSHGLSLSYVFCSGEALTAHLAARFHQHIHGQLHNLYGPTEAAVDVSYWPIPAQAIDDPIPIGRPVWNTQLYVLDDFLRPVPPGVTGTLYIGGVQLAEGYLGRPDLTAQQFILNPFYPDSDALLYDTGDLACWRTDGAIVYQGRADHQIKLRGQRIELGEIESCLSEHPGLCELAIIAREDEYGQAIVAYVVAEEGAPEDSEQILHFARQHLPDYMVPSAVVWLDALPINANGKLDRRALPAPERQRTQGSALVGDRHYAVAKAYQQTLNLETLPYADDDFFALGGHSLLAAQLAAHLRAQYPLELSLGALFEHTTVERLAHYIEQRLQSDATDTNVGFSNTLVLRPGTKETAQPALFCIHPAGGLSWCYGLLARQLEGDFPIIGLQSTSLTQLDTTTSLHDMAVFYADLIQAQQAQGPYHLLGWSVGGILVHEVALVLQERGAELGVISFLDAYPSEIWRNQAEPEADTGLKALLYIAGYDPDLLPELALTPATVIQFLRDSGHALGELSDQHLQGVLNAVELNNRLVRGHHHRVLSHPVLYFQAALDHQEDQLTPELWQPWVSQLHVEPVASLHAHLTGEVAMQHIVPALEQALQSYSLHPSPCR